MSSPTEKVDTADAESMLTCTLQLNLLKNFGSFDEVWGDTIVCRLVHVILAAVRPEVSLSDVCSCL